MADHETRSIDQTLARLAWGTDQRDLDAIVDCYAERAVWTRRKPDGSEDRLDGRDAISAHLTRSWATNPRKGITKHVVTNVMIDQHDDERASVVSYKTGLEVIDGAVRLASVATYTDEFVNEAGVWRIASRILAPEGTA